MKTIYLVTAAFIFQMNLSYAQNYFYIHGYRKNSVKSDLSDFLNYCVNFYHMENTTIAIMQDNLPKRINGAIEYEEAPVDNRKMILIRINENINTDLILYVVAHEMVHAHQFYSRDLVRTDQETYLWKGLLYENILAIKHCDRPWEIEAEEQAITLLNETS